jgi:hypothetical protein
MKVRKGLLAIAAGAILATASVGYSAPADQNHRNNDRQQGNYTNNRYQSYDGNSTYQGHYGNQQSGWYAQRDDRFDQKASPRRQSSRERERFSSWKERYGRPGTGNRTTERRRP